MFLRKCFLPWTAADQFETDAQFLRWLKKRQKQFFDLRMILLIAAAACLIIGYMLNSRPVMLLTIAPLALVLLLSVALDRMDPLLDGQNKTET